MLITVIITINEASSIINIPINNNEFFLLIDIDLISIIIKPNRYRLQASVIILL